MGQERKHSHRRLSSAKPHTATVQLSAANQPDPRKSSGGRGTVFRQDTRTLEIVRSLKGFAQKLHSDPEFLLAALRVTLQPLPWIEGLKQGKQNTTRTAEKAPPKTHFSCKASLKGYSQKRRAIARNTGPTTGKVSIRWRQTKVRDCKIELRSISKWRLRSRR